MTPEPTITTTPGRSERGRSTALLAVLALAVLLVGGVVVWWLSRGDAPEEANLETAAASVSDDESDGQAEGAEEPDAADDGASDCVGR